MKNLHQLACSLMVVVIVVLFSFFITENAYSQSSKTADNFQEFREQFLNPGKDYRSAPLWVWNTKVTEPIIDSMLNEFKKNAFGGVFVHPRPGLITEYLSPEWFHLFKYTVEEGKKLGLNVWIYDENSYPSGFAGGLVPDEMPESYNQGEMLHLTKTDTFPENIEKIFVCLKEENGDFIDITNKMSSEIGKTGNYYLFNKENYQKQYGVVGPPDFSYVDLMVKGVTQKFLEVTMKGYEKVAGDEFGKTVKGLFSDEPSIPTWGSNTVRWTPDLFQTFEERWGYKLQSNLASLFEEVGNWKKVRHNYIEVLSDLFIERWSKPMSEYAAKHDLIWTGHYWEHGWPSANDVPDNMAMYAWHEQPGIDMLFNQFNEESPNAQFGNIRAVKELRSVANQLGKKRTLSETYGGAGWEITFKDMKRLGDWEYVLGVNFLNQHLSWMTITGARKYDYPQTFSYHNPWFPYYKNLNEYFARLSFALSTGEQQNDILIIEPTTSAWMYFVHGRTLPGLTQIGENFQSFITKLEKAQSEYDLGSERIIKDHGKVENGKFIVGQRAYKTVVIPPGMENIDLPTFKLLKTFAEQGGKIIQFENLQTVDGDDNKAVEFFNNNSKMSIHLNALPPTLIKQYFNTEDFEILPQADDSIGGDLYHQRRILTDGQLIFLSNADMNHPSKGNLVTKGADVILLNPFNGESLRYPHRSQQGKLNLSFEIPQAGSLLFYVADKTLHAVSSFPVSGDHQIVKTTTSTILRPAENTLMIDFCDVTFSDTSLKETHVVKASTIVFQHYGFNGDPWDHQVQFKKEFVSRDTFSKGTGFVASYHFQISDDVNFQNFRAVFEQRDLWNTIRVNGTVVSPEKNEWWLDRSFGVIQLGKYLKPGDNILSLEVNPMSVYAEIAPVYILGDFNLASAEKGFKIVSPRPLQFGSWKSQGLPLYGGKIVYKKEFNCTDPQKQFMVQLHNWKGTVVNVKVNNQDAGIIISEPSTLDISKFLKKGKNTIDVEVVGSFKNLLGPHHKSPKPGLADPWKWKNIDTYPPGKDYDTYDYGLMEDFEIVKVY
jgi:hypothetical protein